jgi:hypothetical protein
LPQHAYHIGISIPLADLLRTGAAEMRKAGENPASIAQFLGDLKK